MRSESATVLCREVQDGWEALLLNSSRKLRCRRVPPGSETPGDCEEWDEIYNSSDDPELNALRQVGKANYAIWVHDFASRLDAKTGKALRTFYRDGACLPCLGRMLYDYLRLEFHVTFLELRPNLASQLASAASPNDVNNERGRRLMNEMRTLQNFAAMKLIEGVKIHCKGRVHYAKLAHLLNHGESCSLTLEGGPSGPMSFPKIRTKYTERMLRHRESCGIPDQPILTMLSLSLEKAREFYLFMKSRTR